MGLKSNALIFSFGCLSMNAAFADSARILKIEPRIMAVQTGDRWEDSDCCNRWDAIFPSSARRPKTATVYEVTYDYGGRVMRDTLSYIPINDVEVDKVGRARRLPYDNRP